MDIASARAMISKMLTNGTPAVLSRMGTANKRTGKVGAGTTENIIVKTTREKVNVNDGVEFRITKVSVAHTVTAKVGDQLTIDGVKFRIGMIENGRIGTEVFKRTFILGAPNA